jgi:formylglycine-generating enzyme required for sulfatase activity
MPTTRKLNVFLSYATPDVEIVRGLYQRLAAESWIFPWFDRESLLPGMDWKLEIDKALHAAEVIILCLSTKSVTREGYVQKEIKRALDYADEKLEGTIFVIPLRLDECETPLVLKKLQWVDNFAENAQEKLLKALRLRAEGLGVTASISPKLISASTHASENLDLYRFIQIPASSDVPYPFWIGKYPVTNAQYERFLEASDFAAEEHWKGWLKFNENCIQIGRWKNEGWDWLQSISGGKRLEPRFWQDDNFGISNPENPVVGVTWYEANAYSCWLASHWFESIESRPNPGLSPRLIRLPLESEWVFAAGGDQPIDRYPWDAPGKVTVDQKEIVRRANVAGGGIDHTTPVNAYLRGASPFGVMDLAGNVWEWQANYYDEDHKVLGLRGGSWDLLQDYVRVSFGSAIHPYYRSCNFGFRVVALPS